MPPFNISPSTSISKVRDFFEANQEELKESEERRNNLEKKAVMMTGEEIYVHISGDSAYIDLADADSEMGMTDRVYINVRSEIPEQVSTNLDEEEWEFLVQKTDLLHEVGHYKYSDWPSFEEQLERVPDDMKNIFKEVWDAIEDGAVERFIIEKKDVEDDFRITNDNLYKAKEPKGTVTLKEAVIYKLYEYVHPLGWIDMLLDDTNTQLEFLTQEDRETFEDELLPEIESRVPDILDEKDPVDRNEMIYELFDIIRDDMEDSRAPGMDIDLDFEVPEDAEEMGLGTQGESPDGLEDADLSEIELEEPDEKTVIDKQQDYSEQVEREEEELDSEQDNSDAEEWVRVIDREYENGVSMSLQVPEDPPKDGSYDSSTMQEAKRLSQPIAREFRARLQKARKKQKQTKKKSGKVDSKRAHKSQQGKANVFKKTSDPDEKEYACMLVLDRSGSMGGYQNMVPDAEISTGALAFALEEIGVDVGQLSLYDSNVWLEKDFGEDVDDAKERMFRDCNAGGTPMSDALALARARLEIAGDSPFVIVVTDGEPDHRERYRDELEKCNFPVLGVYIDDDGTFNEQHLNENAYFHSLEMREHQNAVDGVRHMAKNTLF